MKVNVFAFFAMVAAATMATESNARLTREEKLAFETRIVGGTTVSSAEEYPWIASMQVSGDPYCGASLIGKRWLLTAAHCLEFAKPSSVVLKQLDLDGSTRGRVVRKVDRVYSHPQYDSFSMENDIALMRLSQPINNIEPIALASAQEYKAGLNTKALGWGATSQGGPGSSKLRIVTVPLVSQKTCTARPSYPGDIDQATMVCAGFPQGKKDSCQGDSGGPLMHQGSDGVAKLYGVVSWGEGCAQRNKYGVYAKVSAFRDWVKKQTKNEVNPDDDIPATPTSSPTIATISPTPPGVEPESGWEGWLAENQYCKAIRNRRRCAEDPRCDFKQIKGLNRGRKKCFPSRAICLPE